MKFLSQPLIFRKVYEIFLNIFWINFKFRKENMKVSKETSNLAEETLMKFEFVEIWWKLEIFIKQLQILKETWNKL